VQYCRKKFTFAISSPDEFLSLKAVICVMSGEQWCSAICIYIMAYQIWFKNFKYMRPWDMDLSFYPKWQPSLSWILKNGVF